MVAGRGPRPALVLDLVEALPGDSATVAAMRGGREWRGWTKQVELLADVYDAINVGTRATGRWKRKPPKIPAYPRPKGAKGAAAKRRGQSIADVRRVLGMPQLPPHIPQPQQKK